MTAGKRLGLAIGVAALALAAAPAPAQTAPPPPEDTPATDSIGPRELQNYSIDGTVTRRAEPPPQQQQQQQERPAITPRPPAARAAPAPSETTAAERPADAPPRAAQTRDPVPSAIPSQPTVAPPAAQLPRPAPSVTVPLPPLDGRVSAPDPGPAAEPDSDSASLSPRPGMGAWPWLLAALALALGGLYLWRGRTRPALAGGPRVDAFVAPQPPAPRAPAPIPTPAPVPSATPAFAPPIGVVSTRLRPRLEMHFNPLRCSVDGEQVVVDFELELFNSGSAPARAVLIEASLFNAGQSQDQAIGAFFANPVGEGERIAAIGPLKRFAVRSQVVAPRANVQLFNVEGREVFVPVIAFNALYRWTNGEGQTSAAHLVGRDTKAARLAPLRADLGAREYRDLGARQLPNAVRD